MASVVNLQVLYSGQSRCFWLAGLSVRVFSNRRMSLKGAKVRRTEEGSFRANLS